MDPRVREGDGMSRVALPKLSRTVVDVRGEHAQLGPDEFVIPTEVGI